MEEYQRGIWKGEKRGKHSETVKLIEIVEIRRNACETAKEAERGRTIDRIKIG